jgi:hypothetical protein
MPRLWRQQLHGRQLRDDRVQSIELRERLLLRLAVPCGS